MALNDCACNTSEISVEYKNSGKTQDEMTNSSWDNISKAFENKETIKGRIKCRTKGGMIVDIFEMEAFLPGSQIDLKRVSDYDAWVGETIDLMVIRADFDPVNIIVSRRQLLELELEKQKKKMFTKLEKGLVVQGIVTQISTYGVFIDLGGIKGLLHICDIFWGRKKDIKEMFQIGQDLRVVVLDFDESKEQISFGFKQLTPQPWDTLWDISVGECVKGKVVQLQDYGAFIEIIPGVEGLFHVSEMSPDKSKKAKDFMTIGDEVEVAILDFNREKQQLAFGYKTKQVVQLKVVEINYPGRVVTEPFEEYFAGVLLPQNIYYKGSIVPIDVACDVISSLISVGQIAPFMVKGVLEGGKYALLEMNIIDELFDENRLSIYGGLTVGGDYNVSIVDTTPDYYILSVENSQLRGYIEKNALDIIDVNKIFFLRLDRKGETELHLSRFVKPRLEESGLLPDIHMADIEDFFTKEELAAISEEDSKLVQKMLNDYAMLTREIVDQVTEFDIYCRMGDNHSSLEIRTFLKKNPDYFSCNTFWLNIFEKDGQERIVLFDENFTVVVIDASSEELHIDQFYADKRTNIAKTIIGRNRGSKLKIKGSQIHLVNRYDSIPLDYRAEQVVDYCRRLNTLNKRILKDIKKSIRDKTNNDAKEYRVLKDYLDFEKDREEHSGGQILEIPHDRLKPVAGRFIGDSVTLSCRLNDEEFAKLVGDDTENPETSDGLYVSQLNLENVPVLSGILNYDEDGTFHLEFLQRRHVNIDEFLIGGIRLLKKVNTKHFDVQLNALNKFVKYDSLGIHQKLVFGDFRKPDTSNFEQLTYYNEKFEKAEPDNRQCEAVKKALGNQSLLLVQGPPGTGKTTVIIEIIRQLTQRGKKVLVCSQAHAAVTNIYERLKVTETADSMKILRVDNEGESESWGDDFNKEDYANFLANNKVIMEHLFLDRLSKEELRILVRDIADYGKISADKYKNIHHNLCKYYSEISDVDKEKLMQIFPRLQMETSDIAGALLEVQRYQSVNVILGTCIGIGTNRTLKGGAVCFDTVIIDEAAKANLAETIVPLQLGKRFILVGDDNQLPPYIDRETIKSFVKTANRGGQDTENILSEVDVIKSLSTSLFEDFRSHPNFPSENCVLLNYQYRMNPDIGNYISKLFYKSELKNGVGTEKQTIDIHGYPAAITFFDTTSHETNSIGPNETRLKDGSVYNQREIDIICNDIIPHLLPVLADNPSLEVGIISPYSAQCSRLRSRIKDERLRICTIDSIQGSEFDVVIFSFVRSFPKKSNKNVGFLDDMRRLNVSLSRAKKKMILVGNADTLLNPNAHPYGDDSIGGFNPVDVFCSITENAKRVWDMSPLEYFLQNPPEAGYIFTDCEWSKLPNVNWVRFTVNWQDRNLFFNMPYTFSFEGIAERTFIKVLFKGYDDKTGKPRFEHYNEAFEEFLRTYTVGDIIENVQICKEIEAGLLLCVAGVTGLLHKQFIDKENEQYFSVGNFVTIRVARMNLDRRRISFEPVFNMAEQIKYGKFRSFVCMLERKREYPFILLKFEDGSCLEMKTSFNLFIWNVVEEQHTYTFIYSKNQVVGIDRSRAYAQFLNTHDEYGVYEGEVVGEHDFNFIVCVDGYHGTLRKNHFLTHAIQIGNRYHFSIYNVDNNRKSIIYRLER